MIIFEKNVKANENLSKMFNLSKALAECGIESELRVDHDENIIALSTNLWNCCDGKDVTFCVYTAEFEGWELSSYAEPEGQMQAMFAEHPGEE